MEIGTGKADITCFKKGVGMMGYGMAHNIVQERGTGQNARAFAFKDPTGNKVVFVNAEVAFIAISVKRGVIKRLQRLYPELGYDFDNVFLSAQHTHSAPGGFSHYGFYNFSIPGFVPEVYQAIVDGIVNAIIMADKSLKPASAWLHKGAFAPDKEVAFNRSIKAYNRNPEATPVNENQSHLAIDRIMKLLRIDDSEGKPMGAITWFGVHCTSLSNDNLSINFDNKGYAAQYLEEDIRAATGNEHFVAAFAQDTAGDVSPNYIWDKKKKWTRGKFEDDVKSAEFNGTLQYEKAKEIFDEAQQHEEINGNIDYVLMYANFASIIPDPEFTNGEPEARTGPACLGVDFLMGTKEGPGADAFGKVLITAASETVKMLDLTKALFLSGHEKQKLLDKYKIQDPKKIIIETGERKIAGTSNLKSLPIPGFIDPLVKTLKEHYRTGSLDHKPWTPQTLPLHIVVIGTLAIAGIPCEITTMAGQRLRDTIANILSQRGVKQVLLTSYANAYSGYITTYEEYQEQCYEGGHTSFGKWTLAAFQTKFKELALELLKKPEDRKIESSVQPVVFTDEELMKRSFVA